MGNEVTIDSLKIQLETDAGKASNGLEALEATLNKIKNATKGGVGLTAVARQLGKVNTEISGINSSSVGKLTGLAKAIDSLSKVKLSTTIAGQLGKINEILPKLDIGDGATKITELVSALKPLEELGKSSLGTTVNALKKLPEAMEKLDTKKLYGQVQSLTRIMRPLAVEMEKIAQGFSAFPSRIQKLIKENEKLSVSTDKVAKHNKNASGSFLDLGAKIMTAYMSVKKVAGIISSFVTKSNNYVENVNLFNVAMGTYAEEAGNYTDQVADIMGIDPSDWMRSQGVFMTLATGFGVASDRAYTMSKNLTQLGYDLSSFFNISTEDAMQKLQSGISGELEPLRRLGYDLSQAKLEATALSLGIDKSVSSMTQAEKAQLRYHAILTQVTSAQGDMARTLDTPANQLRILKAQFEQTGRAIGNIFIPALTAVLPYVNAFFQIIRAVADVIASLFGFELPTIDYSSLENVSGGADAATDSIDGTTDAVKKLQKYTMGFDELNIIDTSSGKSDALDSLGSLNFDLPEYDFLGEAQKSKVSEIVDSMKEWLGITDEIDSWGEFFSTKLGRILGTVGAIGTAFGLWKIGSSVISFFSMLGGKKGGATGSVGSILSPKNTLKGMADVAIIVGGVTLLVEAVGLLTQIPGFEDTMTDGLGAITKAFSFVSDVGLEIGAVGTACVALGKIGVATVAKGFADLAIIIGGMPVLLTAIGAIMTIPNFSDFASTGSDELTKVFKALGGIAVEVGALSLIVVGLGIATPATVASGLAGLAIIVGGLEVLLVALGALNQINGFSWIVNEGGEVLVQLAEIIGEFAGAIISGFASGLSNSLPEIGQNLGDFMTNAKPFFEGVDDKSLKAVTNLAGAILAITGAEVVDAIGGFLTGDSSLQKFGKELAEFAEYYVVYAEKVKDVDNTVVTASANAAKSIVEFARLIPKQGGLAGLLAGENNISEWGKDLSKFGRHFAKYAEDVKDVDNSVVTKTSATAKSIVEFAQLVPNKGGLVSLFTGDNSLEVWGKDLSEFGRYFKQYYDYIKWISTSVIDNTSSSVTAIIKFAELVPNQGWFSSVNLGEFGATLPAFGLAFKTYYEYIKDCDTANMDSVTNHLHDLLEMMTLPSSDFDMTGLTNLTSGFESLGKAVTAFDMVTVQNSFKKMLNGLISTYESFLNTIRQYASTLFSDISSSDTSKLSKRISIPRIQTYAEGGFVDSGQMFVAREAGAELVGTIGRKTAVVNNEQIIEGIASGVSVANSESNALLREQNALLRGILEKETGVYLDGKHLSDSVDKYRRERGRVVVTGGAY